MWGFPDGTFYAVGEAGTVLYWNGASWSLMDTPVREDLHGIWASAADDVYAAGLGGTLIHFDGLQWIVVPTPTNNDYYAVWASSTNDVFVAGAGGSVWNRTAGNWTEYEIAPGRRFRALWGYSHNEVYAAGSNAALFRFNGSVWTKLIIAGLPEYDPEIRDLWGPHPGSISFVDAYNLIQWLDGTAWHYSSVLDENVYGLWGFSFENLVAVSAGSSTHLVQGSAPTRYLTPTEEPLFDVWGTSTSSYFAVGRYGNIFHFDGAAWQALNGGSFNDISDIAVTGSSAIAVGAGGIVLRQNGTAWMEENVGSGYDLSGVWDGGDGVAVVVGRFTPDGLNWRQAVLTNVGTSWVDAGPIGTAHRLFDVWGSSSSDVRAVGWAGEILHYDGSSWAIEIAEDSLQTATLRSIDGVSATEVFAVGRTNQLTSVVLHFNGSIWTRTVVAGVEDLYGVWSDSPSDVFAVGTLGIVAHFDGALWNTTTTPTQETLFGVWGTNGRNVYAVGWAGTVVHYDGHKWDRLIPATHRSLNAVSGRSANQIFCAGDKGSVLFFDGIIN